jgi:anti-sigma factor RsiW
MCHEMELLMQAGHDGELDAAGSARVAAHLALCADCAAKAASLERLSTALRAEVNRPALPPLLAARAAKLARPTFSRPSLRGLAGGRGASAVAGMALAASLMLVLRPQTPPPQPDEIVSAHIRALQPGHLMDVISTDRHTVKPWFNGRLDYAPPVQDFASSGFPLRGGRLDVLGGRTIGVLVFARATHTIDLAVWPGTAPAGEVSIRGFNVITWSQSGMAFQAVSDLNTAEMRQFRDLWRQG